MIKHKPTLLFPALALTLAICPVAQAVPRIFLGAGETRSVSQSDITAASLSIYGSQGSETVSLSANTGLIKLDQNIETLTLPSLASDYGLRRAGNHLKLYNSAGSTLWVNLVVQNDSDGSVLKFSDKTLSASLVKGVMRLGDTIIPGTGSLVNLPPGDVIPAQPKLNDTGITTCSNTTQNGLACPQTDFPRQDAEFGRDVTHNDDSDGHAGFSFTKLDASGNPLSATAATWSCVRDNVTGLIWEIKTDDGGLRDKDHTYSWYEPDSSKNGGNAGQQNGGSCNGSACDTLAYVQAVNAQGLCGAKDWRLPNRFELSSLVDFSVGLPSIDTDFFPDVSSQGFWSSSPYAGNPGAAWLVYFSYGAVGLNDYDELSANSVRLVRGGQ